MKRRLCAVLVADAADYSALVGRDEDATIRALKAHLDVMAQVIGLHAGRLVKTTGDGLLAEFGSAVDAVSAALLIQRRIAARNAEQADAARMMFRIGVHTGDVVIDGDDILGDGVNVAARLEGVARPGGVAVSARVHEDVVGRLDVAFDDRGAMALKNIERPVHVYEAQLDAPPRPQPAMALPNKPSVAVLPFVNMSAQTEDDWFADGVSEDIITALAGVPWLFVIARNSSFSYKGLAVDVRKVGRDLGVRYVLEGSVRRGGRRLRVTGQLVDAQTGAHLWAERHDGDIEDVFELQDLISAAVVGAIAPTIRGAEIERATRKRPENLDAYDRYLRGLHAIDKGDLAAADGWLAAAAELAPGFAKALAIRGWLETFRISYGIAVGSAVRAHSLALAEAALAADSADPEVCAYAGYTLCFCGAGQTRGMRLVEDAIKRCPSFAWAWASAAIMSCYAGRADEALERAEIAIRLNPRDPLAFRGNIAIGLASAIRGDWPRVLENARQGLDLNPRAQVLLRHAAIALTRLGRGDEAAVMRRRAMAQTPEFRVSAQSEFLRRGVDADEALWRPMIEGMRDAGFPD